MNPFTTVPKLLAVYFAANKFNNKLKAFHKHHYEESVNEEKDLIFVEEGRFVEEISSKLNITYEIIGSQNLDALRSYLDSDTTGARSFMVYSNHQSFADIFAIIWLLKDTCQIGFVAKEEWRKVKPLADAIINTRSIFLNRSNSREAVKTICEATELLNKGFNLAIFPEGTRSQKHEMGEIRSGAFKFAQKANVPILPITLDGGYRLLEETGSYQPAHITITVHPLVHIEEMSREEQKLTFADIEARIRSAL